MPLVSNVVTNVIGRKKVITTADDGAFLLLSDTGGSLAGVWVVHFVSDPDAPFVGSLSVQSRIQGQQAYSDLVAFDPTLYRAWTLNGVISDLALRSDAITGQSKIVIPATGLAVAFLVTCSGGKGTLYSYPREGDGAF